MKKDVWVVMVCAALLLSLVVVSQPEQRGKDSKISSKDIQIKENKHCDVVDKKVSRQPKKCEKTIEHIDCTNSSGPNTGCSKKTDHITFECPLPASTVPTTTCKTTGLVVTQKTSKASKKHEFSYSDFGPCIYEQQDNCVVVTCVSLHDGAHKGEFTRCDGGQSCQQFKICKDEITSFHKNSQRGFVEDDASFHLKKLEMKEVKE